MSTPRYRSEPPSRSGSAISVWTATTPSRPGLKSFICARIYRTRRRSGAADGHAPRARADVVAHRPDDLVVRVLLEHVSRLAGDPAALEERREEVVGDAEIAVERSAVEVDVRPEPLLLVRRTLGRLRDRVPVRLATLVRELLGELLQDSGAWIGRDINRVAEAEQRLLLRQVASHALGRGLRRAKLLEGPHRRLVG